MVEYIDECVGCPAEIGCVGSSCRYKDVPHYICDVCRTDDTLHRNDDGGELCIDCLFNCFPHGSDDEDTECDECGNGYFGSQLAEFSGVRLCRDCLAKEFKKVVCT